MKKSSRQFYKVMFSRVIMVVGVFTIGCITVSNVKHGSNNVNNINNVKSIEAFQIKNKYDDRNQLLKVKEVSNMR